VVPFEPPIAGAVNPLSSAGGQEGWTGLKSVDGPSSDRCDVLSQCNKICTGRNTGSVSVR
jgi:hypothetical protein